MSSFVRGDLYSGQDIRSQLRFAERQVISLEKDNKQLKDSNDWLDFRVELLEKQLNELQLKQDKNNLSNKTLNSNFEPIDSGKYASELHAKKILES